MLSLLYDQGFTRSYWWRFRIIICSSLLMYGSINVMGFNELFLFDFVTRIINYWNLNNCCLIYKRIYFQKLYVIILLLSFWIQPVTVVLYYRNWHPVGNVQPCQNFPISIEGFRNNSVYNNCHRPFGIVNNDTFYVKQFFFTQ